MPDRTLVSFSKVLRDAGVPVSPAETLDAMRVLDNLGYADRPRLKAGLAMAMAKSEKDRAVFSACFDEFFSFASAPQRGAPADEQALPEATPLAGQGEVAGSGGGASATSSLGQMLERDDPAEIDAALAEAATRTGVSGIRVITQKGLFARRLLQGMGLEALDRELLELNASPAPQDRALAAELRQRRNALRAQAIEEVNRQFLLHGRGEARALREKTMRSVRLEHLREFRDVRALVEKMARRLAGAHRRRRRRARRGWLDVRKTLTASIGHDAVPARLYWKQRRQDRPKVMVICDVSNSVSAAARFLLMFLYAVSDVLPRVRSFAFAADFGEVTDLFEQMDSGAAVETIMARYSGAGTDYGSMMARFRAQYEEQLDRRTTVIFLGDARANDLPPGEQDLARISARAGRVFWLNPEDPRRWNSGDSVMAAYQPWCRAAVSCGNLNQLAAFVDRLLRESFR